MLFLQTENCSSVVFFTASPHHLNAILMDIACTLVSVKRTFLYPIVFSNVVFPISKVGEYHTSEYIYPTTKLYNYSLYSDLIDFFDNSKSKKLPKSNQKIRTNIIYPILYSLRFIISRSKQNIKWLLRGFQLKDKDYSHLIVNPLVLEKSKKISLYEIWFLLLSQWRYIRSYRKRLSSQSLNPLNLSSDRHTFWYFQV